ncbi:MAG: Uma2 family endonuclease [Chloroherpetonaceae bacterium]
MELKVLERRLTKEDYFALEKAEQDVKHEFFGGEIIAMAGAELAHNSICANIIGELRNEIIRKNKKCRVLTSDQRVGNYCKEEDEWGYFYPDVVLVCGTPELADTTPKTLLNPSVVFEVLSKSNTSREILSKLKFYRAIETLTDVLLVDSESRLVMHFKRTQEGDWLTRSYTKAEETIYLPTHGLELRLAEIYRDVELSSTKS